MIRSHDNQKLKTIRKLAQKRWRSELGLFAAEGEDLVEAAAAAGWKPVFVLRADVDVETALLAEASALGSGSRVIGVYEQRWVEPDGQLSVYLHGVSDPGNVGTIIRSAHALADGPVILGPGCADPYSPKAVRASMGSIFARPPARADGPRGQVLALDRNAPLSIRDVEVERGVTLCLGSEREGLPTKLLKQAGVVASIPVNDDGPDSLNVAMAASIGLYELANRMPRHG